MSLSMHKTFRVPKFLEDLCLNKSKKVLSTFSKLKRTTVQNRRIKSHRCPKNDKTVGFSVFLLEAEHLFERKSWADISIQNEESLRTAGDNLISEVIDAPSGAQGWILLQIPAVPGAGARRTTFLQWFCRTSSLWWERNSLHRKCSGNSKCPSGIYLIGKYIQIHS